MKGYARERRPGVWQLAVYVGRQHGRDQYVYRTFTGTGRAANTELARLVAEAADGRIVASSAKTVRTLVEAWWDTASPRLSPTTRRRYRKLLDVYVVPELGAKRLSRFSTHDLDKLYSELEAGTGDRKLAPRSVRQLHAVISGMCAAAVRWGWISSSPAEHAVIPKLPPRVARSPKGSDIAILLAAARDRDPELADFLRLAVATGARRGELCALRWTDVDLDAGELNLARALVHDDLDAAILHEKDTKGHQSRRIALDPGSVTVLRALRRRHLERALSCGGTMPASAFLFSDAPDCATPWRPDRLTLAFRRLCHRTGISGVRLHDLRHYHGTTLAAGGLPLPALRDRLGHRELTTTNIYLDGLPAADRAAADMIGHALDG